MDLYFSFFLPLIKALISFQEWVFVPHLKGFEYVEKQFFSNLNSFNLLKKLIN